MSNRFKVCRTCTSYLAPTGDGENGTCHLYPPTAGLIPTPQMNALTHQPQMVLQVHSAWPPVMEDQWCGQWVSKAEMTIFNQ